jgi:transcriptional regulator with XRE-family HTH domain
MSVTLRDIAEKSGFSKYTVSRVLSGKAAESRIPLETAGKVLAIARELDYRPSASARDTPVIFSAARLNDVTRHASSTVNTPSEILSRMASVYGPGVSLSVCNFFVIKLWYRISP